MEATHLLDRPHERMLFRLCQTLDLLYDLLILLALHSNGYRQSAHDKCRLRVVVLRHRLEVWHVQCACRLVQRIGEILRQPSV